jgi:hypothetical protein
MSKSLPPVWFTSLLDSNGDLLAGGTIDTFAAGTTTPLVTFSDSSGAANTNPVVLDSAGRAAIWLTQDTAYKFVLSDSDGNVLFTVDNIIAISGTSSADTDYEVNCSFVGTPGAQATMAVHQSIRAATFPVDFSGSDASVGTNPGADYAVSVQNNGVEIGTVTFDASGVATFATTGAATQTIAFGDRITFVAPASVGIAADFGITLVATLA